MRFSGPLEPLTLYILGIDCDGACQKTGVGLAALQYFACFVFIHRFMFGTMFVGGTDTLSRLSFGL